MNKEMKIAITGIGNRSLPKNPENSNWMGWVEQISQSKNFELVAAHDISQKSLDRIINRGYLKSGQAYLDFDQMLSEVFCEAILISNPADYHYESIKKALNRKSHVLVEKPFVTDLSIGNELINLIKKNNLIVAVVQNWRTKDVGRLLRESIQNGMIGKVGQIFFRYIRNRENPNYPPYIFQQEFPLLYAMGIHHIDLFRYILNEEIEKVSAHSFKPPWSLYSSDTGLNLFFKTGQDTTIIYSGTFSSLNNILPQESLIIEGENGTLFNESDWLEPPLWFFPEGKKEGIDLTQENEDISIAAQYNKSDSCILENFYRSIKGKEKPVCTAQDALHSIAVIEAAKSSCKTGKTVFLEEFLEKS